jgi:hypothetical protein
MIAAGSSPSIVRKSFNALAQMMRSAVSDRRIPFDPCKDVPLPPEHQGEQRFLNATEVERLAPMRSSRGSVCWCCLLPTEGFGSVS